MDDPILIVAICMESIKGKNSLQTRQPHLQDLPSLQDSYNHFVVEYTWRVVLFLCRSDNFDILYYFYMISENFILGYKEFKK